MTSGQLLEAQLTERDRRAIQWGLKNRLATTLQILWHKYQRAGAEDLALKWWKQLDQVRKCQSEWIGYKAECCGASTRPMAIPIGCRHRLCPLCAYDRSQVARKRIKNLFDRLTHPVLITLTVPSKGAIRKHDFKLFRQKVSKFIAQHGEWIQGGVYSLETTYNRTERTWHLHVHILADVSSGLPTKAEKTVLAGQRVFAFTAIKLKLEFDWLRLWGKAWGKMAGASATRMRREGEIYTFNEWVIASRAARLKEYRGAGYVPIEGLSAEECVRRTEWNRENRRVIDLRPVSDRDGAAKEVLKYLTKIADFGDVPEAVEAFANAVRGARLIQTFGSWYGVNLDDRDCSTDFDPEKLEADDKEDWGAMKCACGLNHWAVFGILHHEDVEMEADGRWLVKQSVECFNRGTVPRPTIRALRRLPEESEDQL
jgi:hypothetical protein